ncbi:MAG: PPC domain-containing protein [Acidobacteria bacterium]|nr:PPC domain-containing protein [Acidobacteriota bacterium]
MLSERAWPWVSLLVAAICASPLEAQADCNACPACVGCTGCPDSFEPNDVRPATGWSLAGATYLSYLCDRDVDFWPLPDLVSGQRILVTLEDLPQDYDLSIFTPSGEVQGYSTDPERNDAIQLEIGTERYPPGSYQVRVRPGITGTAQPNSPYTLSARELSCRRDEHDSVRFEANDRPSHAVVLGDEVASYARAGLTLCPGGDQDWFERHLEGGDEVTVLVDYPRSPGSFELDVCLFGADLEHPVACIDDSRDPRQLTYKVPSVNAREPYRVRVWARAYRSPLRPEYDLVIQAPRRAPAPMPPRFPGCAESALLEPNDRISDIENESFFLLSDGEERRAHICDPTDIDLFKVAATRGQVVQVEVRHPEKDFNLALYDPEGSRLTQMTPERGSGQTILVHRVDRDGSFFVEVTPELASSDAVRPYSLTARAFPCPDSFEPNGDFSSATKIQDDGQRAFSRICHAGDRDFFTFSADAGQKVFLDLDGVGGSDIELRLFTPRRLSLGSTDDRLERVLPSDGDYFVVVASRSGEQWNPVNAYSLSLLLGGSPSQKPAADLRLLGLEVTQGIQDLEHSVPLIAGKETLVRAFVDVTPGGGSVHGVELFLTYLGSDPLAAPGQVRCGDAFLAVPSADRQELRSYPELGPWCRLPSSWLRTPGQLRLRAAVHASAAVELDPADNHRLLELDVQPARTFNLQLIPVRDHCRGTCTEEDGPASELLDELVAFVEGLYPLAEIRRIPFEGWHPYPGTAPQLVTEIFNLQRTPPVTSTTLRIAVMRNTADGRVERGHCGGDSRVGFIRLTSEGPWSLAHEIAHCLGMAHVDDGGQTGAGDFGFEPYPHETNTLGPEDWRGFYATDLRSSVPRVLLPQETADLMTYQTRRWVSDYTYRKLYCLMGTMELSPQDRWRRCTPAAAAPP